MYHTLEEGKRSYATHSPSAPSVCAPDSWSGLGKEVKVRGGWWRGGKGPTGRRTETQNAQDGSSCPSPRTGLQLGAKDPGEGQREEKGEEVAAPGR